MSESHIVRFLITIFLAITFGLARQWFGKPIGFGTFVFVSIGSCALAITALEVAHDGSPLPLLSAVVTGVGFLGAGALVRTTERIAGFTSAATIWVMAVFGLAVGVGQFWTAGILYGAIWLVILLDRVLEKRALGVHQRRLTITLTGTDSPAIESLGLGRALATTVDRESGTSTLVFPISGTRQAIGDLEERLRGFDRLRSYSLQ